MVGIVIKVGIGVVGFGLWVVLYVVEGLVDEDVILGVEMGVVWEGNWCGVGNEGSWDGVLCGVLDVE